MSFTPESFVMLIVGIVFLCVIALAFRQMLGHLWTVNHSRQEAMPVMTALTFDMNYIRDHIPAKKTVKFDPFDREHIAALLMLLDPKSAKLHPTLRFEFDTKVFDTSLQAMVHEFIQQHAGVTAVALAEHHYKEKSRGVIKVDLNGKVLFPLPKVKKPATKAKAKAKPRKAKVAAAPTEVSATAAATEQPIAKESSPRGRSDLKAVK